LQCVGRLIFHGHSEHNLEYPAVYWDIPASHFALLRAIQVLATYWLSGLECCFSRITARCRRKGPGTGAEPGRSATRCDRPGGDSGAADRPSCRQSRGQGLPSMALRMARIGVTP
jgi:hypothetical protein